MNINQDQIAELVEQGKNVYIKKNDWYKKLGLIKEQENGNRNDRISRIQRSISDHR